MGELGSDTPIILLVIGLFLTAAVTTFKIYMDHFSKSGKNGGGHPVLTHDARLLREITESVELATTRHRAVLAEFSNALNLAIVQHREVLSGLQRAIERSNANTERLLRDKGG